MINVVLLLFLLLVFRPAYETNDDMGMANIVNGAKGVYDPHLIFSHYFLGLVLSVLYRITDYVTWYPLLQYAVLFSSFTAVTYVLNRRRRSVSELWPGMLLMIVFAYEGYINLQFTKTAGIAVVSGIFLIFYAVSEERIRKGALAAGVLIACIGSMYRMQQFLAAAFLMTGIGVSQLFRLRTVPAGRRLRKFLIYVCVFGGLLTAALGLRKIDQKIYSSSEQWQEYLAYNRLRGKLYDYGFPPYKDYKEVYQELGIGRTAYRLYQTWTHMDTERFTTEVMEELYEIQPKETFDLDFIRDFFRQFPISFLKIPVFYCFLVILLYWGICDRYRKEEILTLLYELTAVLLMYMYLYFSGRYLLNRVDVGLWMAASLTVMWLLRGERRRLSYRSGMMICAGVLALFQVNWSVRYRIAGQEEQREKLLERAVLEAVRADGEHLYLTKPKMVSFARAYDIFDHIPFGSAQNIYSLGGWSSASPVYARTLELADMANPFRDMIGNEKVYLVDNDIDLTMKYVRKYYDETARAIPVFRYEPYQVYQIVTDSDAD